MGKPESPAGAAETRGRSWRRRPGFLEWGLLLLLLLLTGALAALSLLYAHSGGEWGAVPQPPPPRHPQRPEQPLLPAPSEGLRAAHPRSQPCPWGRRGSARGCGAAG